MTLTILSSGSGANCSVLTHNGSSVLLDAGMPAREVFRALDDALIAPATIQAILLTHMHGDHTAGAHRLAAQLRVPVIGATSELEALVVRRELDQAHCYPIPQDNCFTVGPFAVESVPVQHDTSDPRAFVLAAGGVRLGYFMDMGAIDAVAADVLAHCTAVFIESNHCEDAIAKGPYHVAVKQRVLGDHGHLSNEQVAEWIRHEMPELSHLILGHLSTSANDPLLAMTEAMEAMKERGAVYGRTQLRVIPSGGRASVEI